MNFQVTRRPLSLLQWTTSWREPKCLKRLDTKLGVWLVAGVQIQCGWSGRRVHVAEGLRFRRGHTVYSAQTQQGSSFLFVWRQKASPQKMSVCFVQFAQWRCQMRKSCESESCGLGFSVKRRGDCCDWWSCGFLPSSSAKYDSNLWGHKCSIPPSFATHWTVVSWFVAIMFIFLLRQIYGWVPMSYLDDDRPPQIAPSYRADHISLTCEGEVSTLLLDL